jgi:hypothetical protein
MKFRRLLEEVGRVEHQCVALYDGVLSRIISVRADLDVAISANFDDRTLRRRSPPNQELHSGVECRAIANGASSFWNLFRPQAESFRPSFAVLNALGVIPSSQL